MILKNKKKAKNWIRKNKKPLMYISAFMAMNFVFYIGDIITFFETRMEQRSISRQSELKQKAELELQLKNSHFAFILKATSVIRRGEVLAQSQIEEIKIPKEEYKENYHHAQIILKDLSGYIAARHMEPGDILHDKNFIPKDKLFIQKVLKPNFRSIYLNVEPDQIVNPAIYPGMRVDIAISKSTSQGTKTERVMCAVKILDMTKSETGTLGITLDDSSFIVFEIAKDESASFLSISQQYKLIFLPISSAESIEDRELVCAKEAKYGVKIFRGL